MTNSSEGKAARRFLWALVIGVVVLNLVLFLVFSRSRASSPAPARDATNTSRGR